MQPQAHPPSAVPKSLYPQANVSEGELLFTRFAHEHPRSCQGRPYSCADWVILTPHEIRRWEKIAALVQSPAGGFLRFHKSLPQGTSEEAAGQQWLRLPEERRQAWGWGVVKIIHGFPGVRTVSSPATPPAATPHTTMPATASAASNNVTVKVYASKARAAGPRFGTRERVPQRNRTPDGPSPRTFRWCPLRPNADGR